MPPPDTHTLRTRTHAPSSTRRSVRSPTSPYGFFRRGPRRHQQQHDMPTASTRSRPYEGRVHGRPPINPHGTALCACKMISERGRRAGRLTRGPRTALRTQQHLLALRDGVLATRPCELVEERRNEWSCIETLWLMTIDCAVWCATKLISCVFVQIATQTATVNSQQLTPTQLEHCTAVEVACAVHWKRPRSLQCIPPHRSHFSHRY
jgi:hypothetical protein